MQPLVVVVDGNNLAKEEFYIEGRYVPPHIDKKIIANLSSWARAQKIPCKVKLFLDPRNEFPASSAFVSVRVAEHGTIADDYIVEHVQVCCLSGEACVVVTNDEELQDRVAEIGVQFISVYDFVQRKIDKEKYLSLDLFYNEDSKFDDQDSNYQPTTLKMDKKQKKNNYKKASQTEFN